MISKLGSLLFLLVSPLLRAETIDWYSVAGSTHLTSNGVAMGRGFSFELGVFRGSFVPNAANTNEWAANWVAAQRVAYFPETKRFAGRFSVEENTADFAVGKEAWVWGFRGGSTAAEWVLFRAPSWKWPRPVFPPNPLGGLDWNAAAATAVVGEIHASGSPQLIRTAAVAGAATPPTHWEQWRDTELAGTNRNSPSDDADGDGMNNLLEFAFGTPPVLPGPPPDVRTEIVVTNGARFLQATLPRRADHLAELVPQVSPDLIQWSTKVEIVSDSISTLVVRDITPLETGSRYFRLQVRLPEL